MLFFLVVKMSNFVHADFRTGRQVFVGVVVLAWIASAGTGSLVSSIH